MKKALLTYLLFLPILCLTSCHPDEIETEVTLRPATSEQNNSVPETGLPVVYIRTHTGQGIIDKETWIPATLHIMSHDSLMEIYDTIYIKGRGNATWRFDKKAFNMKCSHKQSILGMKKHKRWVFLANYHDRTLMRNELTFFIGQLCDGLEWTPHCRYAEVVLNGKYQGNYLITEQIRIDRNRVDIDDLTNNDTLGSAVTGGYILEMDHYYDRAYKFHTICHALPVGVVAPDENSIRAEQFRYIRSFVNDFDHKLLNGNTEQLFADYVDMASFVDYYIVQTLTGNHEMTAPRSVYCYKKRNGPLFAGPLWDFDFSTYNSADAKMNTYSIWYRSLFKRNTFRKYLKARWGQLRPVFEDKILQHIEETATLLQRSQKINFELFPVTASGGYKNGDENLDYDTAIQKLKDVIQQRIARMDAFIKTL